MACKDCIHWGKPVTEQTAKAVKGQRVFHMYDTNFPHAICKKLQELGVSEDTIFYNDRVCLNTLLTGANFECIHYKSKQS